MRKLILTTLLGPTLCFGEPSGWFDIEHVRIHQIGDVEGLYLLEWDGTYWAQLELLEYCKKNLTNGSLNLDEDDQIECIDTCKHFNELDCCD